MAVTQDKKREWWEYLNQITDVVTGKTVPTYEFSLETSTIVKMAVGLFFAITFAMLVNQLFIRLFKSNTAALLLIMLSFSVASQAQSLYDCREMRTYKGASVEICEDKQVIVGCKADSILVFYQNAYISDTLINDRICKISHQAIVRKTLTFVPIYATQRVCRAEITGDIVREVFIDCK